MVIKVYLKLLFASTKVVIYEITNDASFQQMFGDFGEKRRCWKDKEEALRFSHEHKDKLGPNGNFFELEGGLVAYVRLDRYGQPEVLFVDPLSNDFSWPAKCQFHVSYPQQ